jgi:hypothetical protein
MDYMRQKSQLVLPCDPEYTAHRETQKRRQETREWLLQRERANVAPSIVWLLQRERANVAPSIVPDVPEAEPQGERGRHYSHSRR